MAGYRDQRSQPQEEMPKSAFFLVLLMYFEFAVYLVVLLTFYFFISLFLYLFFRFLLICVLAYSLFFCFPFFLFSVLIQSLYRIFALVYCPFFPSSVRLFSCVCFFNLYFHTFLSEGSMDRVPSHYTSAGVSYL